MSISRSILHKSFDLIDESDLNSLIENKIIENDLLEYKQAFPEDLKFLTGITAFANTMGGDILVGIREDDGVPIELVGMDCKPDFEIRRWEQKLEASIQPRLPQIRIREIPLQNGKFVLLFRIARSWSGPHRVMKEWQFYKRRNQQKSAMDMDELRQHILGTASRLDVARTAHEGRFKQIYDGHLVPGMRFPGRAILYVAVRPLSVSIDDQNVVFRQLREGFDYNLLPVSGASSSRIVVDGYFRYGHKDDSVFGSHFALLRNGTAEFSLITDSRNDDGATEEFLFQSPHPERQILRVLKNLLPIYENELGIGPPFAIFTSYAIRKQEVSVRISTNGFDSGYPLQEKAAWKVAESLIEDSSVYLPGAMRNTFDSIYNLFGVNRSPYFNDEGKWTGGEY